MTDERVEEVLFDINGKLSSIDTKLDTMSETVLKHESRLTMIERQFTQHIQSTSQTEGDFKQEMLKLIGKCLIVALTAISSMVGTGGLLMKMSGHLDSQSSQGSTQSCNRAQ